MKKWKLILPIAAVVVVAAGGVFAMNARAEKNEKDTIADRIYIGDVAVGGMTEDEAKAALSAYVADLEDEKITLTVKDKKTTVKTKSLGMFCDSDAVVSEAMDYGKTGNLIARYKAKKELEHNDKVLPMSLSVEEQKAEKTLKKKAKKLNRDAVDYGLERKDGEFKVTGGKEGIQVNVEKAVQDIQKALEKGWKDQLSVELTAEIEKPQGSEEELKQVKDVLGTFTTSYGASAWGRKANIANGCSKINGSLIYPGEEFSVYQTVKPFDKEHGYELAGAYENGATVDAYGGGICQVSTTLYNALIRAELEITERSGHSMLVAYVDPSADAAIAGDYKDLKFKNNSKYPIYIDGHTDGSQITFTVYGVETRPANREVSFVSETTGTTQPTVKYQASGAAIGSISQTQSAHVGKSARLWKIVKVDGKEQSKEIFNTTSYRMSPTIYSVGTASSSSEATAAMNAAIATQNDGKIRAAASEWSASALKKKEEEKQKKDGEDKQKEEKEGQGTGDKSDDKDAKKSEQNEKSESSSKSDQTKTESSKSTSSKNTAKSDSKK